MKVNFKVPREIDGVTYQKGVQEVPDSLKKHWYLLAIIQNGNASIVEEGKPAPVAPKKKEAAPKLDSPANTYREHQKNWESEEEKKLKEKHDAKSEAPPEGKPETKAEKAKRLKEEKKQKLLAKAEAK